jgi:phosphatidylserine decarboxylase
MVLYRMMLFTVAITIVLTVAAFFLFWRFWFLRDPERIIPDGDNIVSPADGKVIRIINIHTDKPTIEKGILGLIETETKDIRNACYLVSIFMSPLDVHVQRAPINGRIAHVEHMAGRFRAANSIRALENEHNEIIIDDVDCVKVIQIAGFLARRIECFVKKGDRVIKGQKIGRINLGSQVSVILPKNIVLRIKEGERVTAGETVIADFD